jgi:hypothetical protein
MVELLRDPAYFARVFLEDGAPTWPNGFDMDPEWLRREIEATGGLAWDGPHCGGRTSANSTTARREVSSTPLGPHHIFGQTSFARRLAWVSLTV